MSAFPDADIKLFIVSDPRVRARRRCDELKAKGAEVDFEQVLDNITSRFVIDNFDNVLGPWAFMAYVSRYQYPITDPWIEDIMSKATSTFKNNYFVKDYYAKAQENEQIINGMKDPETATPPITDPNAAPAPTPNELAMPADSSSIMK